MTNNQPWICPKCQRVYGPNTLECKPCNQLVTLSSLFGSTHYEESEELHGPSLSISVVDDEI